ncbi:hypothetical protein LY76DRAFT_197362 [Colletotrichum caudatum]|nr:hypothetical protein LY76DRAFT_197362 [Colletotrichum caudatum]
MGVRSELSSMEGKDFVPTPPFDENEQGSQRASKGLLGSGGTKEGERGEALLYYNRVFSVQRSASESKESHWEPGLARAGLVRRYLVFLLPKRRADQRRKGLERNVRGLPRPPTDMVSALAVLFSPFLGAWCTAFLQAVSGFGGCLGGLMGLYLPPFGSRRKTLHPRHVRRAIREFTGAGKGNGRGRCASSKAKRQRRHREAPEPSLSHDNTGGHREQIAS